MSTDGENGYFLVSVQFMKCPPFGNLTSERRWRIIKVVTTPGLTCPVPNSYIVGPILSPR